jgi:hypothetical protein
MTNLFLKHLTDSASGKLIKHNNIEESDTFLTDDKLFFKEIRNFGKIILDKWSIVKYMLYLSCNSMKTQPRLYWEETRGVYQINYKIKWS